MLVDLRMISCLLAIFSYVQCSPITTHALDDNANGSCQCAVFRSGDVQKASPLIVRDTEIEMPTDNEGKVECIDLCVALAEANKEEAPKILCEAVKGDVDHLEVHVNYRLRNEPWIFTGKINSIPICCRGGISVTCGSCLTVAP